MEGLNKNEKELQVMKTIEELGISPAPWKADIGVYSFWVDDNAEGSVCMKDCTSMNDRDIDRRNARLIAAAPELYEALAALLNCSEKEAPFTMESGMSIAMAMARKAIEKAGGAE